MITLQNVTKRYNGKDGYGPAVISNLSLTVRRNEKIALIGANGAGKSTLLNLISGMDRPTLGAITRQCNVSWPLGLTGGFQGSLTGAQNVRFVARIHGVSESDLAERTAFVKAFSELGDALDHPVKSYSTGMRSRLAFALSLAFDFDMYLVDELTAVGDAAFRKKSREAFRSVVTKAGLVMVSHDEATLKSFCDSALWLHEGQAHRFDSVDEALACYLAHPR